MTDVTFTSIRDVKSSTITHYPNETISVISAAEAIRLFPRIAHAMSMWAIFDHPRDYPNGFVVRENIICRDHNIYISPYVIYAATIEEARHVVPKGLFRMQAFPDDVRHLAETWF